MNTKVKARINYTCPRCRTNHSILVYEEDYQIWLQGHGLVQEIFPYLSARDRETFITGICPSCWNEIFSELTEE